MNEAPNGHAGDGEAGQPTPLFLPPAAGKPQQQSDERQPEPASGHAGGSAILAAAELLMQPPKWADFEPGTLIGAGAPADTPAVQEQAPAEPVLEEVLLATPEAESVSLSMLLLDDGTASA